MICYSDFIFSLSPWAYCRLDEPEGYTLFHDSTGNGNHLKSLVEGTVTNNRQNITLLGDPFIAGISPVIESHVLKIGSVDFAIRDIALRFNVPTFKSDTSIYRRGKKIQNNTVINSMWIDFLMDVNTPNYHETMKTWLPINHFYATSKMSIDNLYLTGESNHISGLSGENTTIDISKKSQSFVMNETFLRFGSLALVGITGVHYNENGGYLGYSYRLALVTQVFNNNEWNDKVLWNKTLVTVDPINHPATPLTAGTHRFTIGVISPSTYSMTVKVSVDGLAPETINIVLDENESFLTYDDSVYSVIAIMNNTTFSNLSVFFNQVFPSTEWLTASQKALVRTYKAPIAEDSSILRGGAPSGYPSIEKLPGSLFNALNRMLLFGVNQRLVSELFPTEGSSNFTVRITPSIPGITVGNIIKINQNKQSPFSGCWKVYALNTITQVSLFPATSTLIPATITRNSIDYDLSYQFTNEDFLIVLRTESFQYFSIGYLVTLHYFTDITQSHSWTVTSVDANGFNVIAQNILPNYGFNDDCLIKQTPIGGGCWTKTFSENSIGFGYKDIEAYKKNILIDDREPTYAVVYLSETDNSAPSENLYIPKDIKSNLNKETSRFPSCVVGDCHRLYWFLPSKQNTVSHTSVIVFGEVFDWFNQDWCSIAMVSLSNHKDQDIGFNYAFLYPDWSIDLSTGFLICKSFKSHSSDGRVLIKENGNIVPLGFARNTGQYVYPITLPVDRNPIDAQPPTALRQFWTSDGQINMNSAFGDSGQHVYPINIPFISFAPS